jgi:hypothetical protein
MKHSEHLVPGGHARYGQLTQRFSQRAEKIVKIPQVKRDNLEAKLNQSTDHCSMAFQATHMPAEVQCPCKLHRSFLIEMWQL